jgi:hypothetical protein
MSAHHLGLDEARQIAVRAALLEDDRPTALRPMIEQLGMLRVELTTTVCPAADHVAWSRLGDQYTPEQTERALAGGELFERSWMLRPMSDLGLYLAGMRSWGARSGGGGWVEANAAFARRILDRIAAEGPLTSRDIPDEAVVPWPSTGWSNDRNVTKMLENLHMSGELAVIGRVGKLRIWELARRVFPNVAEVPLEDAHRIRSEQILRACGVMRDSKAVAPGELHGNLRVGEPATIEGVPGKWLVDAAARAVAHRHRLLAAGRNPLPVRPAHDGSAARRAPLRLRLHARNVQTDRATHLGSVHAADFARRAPDRQDRRPLGSGCRSLLAAPHPRRCAVRSLHTRRRERRADGVRTLDGPGRRAGLEDRDQ